MSTEDPTDVQIRGLRYVELAKELGVNVEDPYQVTMLLKCARFCELQFSGKFRNQEEVAKELGVSPATLHNWVHNGMMAIASKITLAEIYGSEARESRVTRLFGIIDEWLPKVLLNQARIAAGAAILDDDGQPVLKGNRPVHPAVRDQVSAANTLFNSQIGAAYLTTLLTGDSLAPGVDPHMIIRKALSERSSVVHLDEVIDGEVRALPAPVASEPPDSPDEVSGAEPSSEVSRADVVP